MSPTPSQSQLAYSVRPALQLQPTIATWLVLLLLCAGIRLWKYDGDSGKAFDDLWVFQLVSILALLRLLVPLVQEPLLLRVDTQVETLTLGRFRLPWKMVLDLRRVHCRINEQVSHSGTQSYFLLFLDNQQLLDIEVSTRWPLAKLQALQQHINRPDNKKAR